MPTLHWIGKDKVINHHMDVPFKVLEHSYGFDNGTQSDQETNSGNKIIHGDNLEALKALLPEYEGRIKCIYIDPPYNTGNEGWVYNDNVNDPKIKKWLGQVVGKESEVKDQWGIGEATQVHHIFPRAEFPELAHYVENLILLTATQHNTKAHPNNRTQQINKDYQLTCLLAKSDSIENSLRKGEFVYRKESFVFVLNTGLSEELDYSLDFSTIKRELTRIYNAA